MQLKNETGLVINEESLKISDSKDSILRYVVNGLLIFFATYGSLTCFTSAFEIEIYNGLLFFILLILGMLYAFMHVNKNVRKIGYVVVFVSYIYMIVKLRIIIKSGFSTMVNTVRDYMDELWVLPVTIRFTEYVDDSKMAVTICLVVIGFVISLLLNIIISEFMSVFMMLLLTFPIVQFGMYFELKMSVLSCAMYISSVITVFVIKKTGKYMVRENTATFRHKQRKKTVKYDYTCEPYTMSKISGIILAGVSAVVIVLSPFININNFGAHSNIKNIKKQTNGVVKDFAISGFAGLFRGNKASGGLSNGQKLGQADIIMLDYKTDFIASYVPVNQERFFLKSFTGCDFKKNSWSQNIPDKDENLLSNREIYNLTSSALKNEFINGTDGIYRNKIDIRIIDSYNNKFVFAPYYHNLKEKDGIVLNGDNMQSTKYNEDEDVVIQSYEYYTDVRNYDEKSFDTISDIEYYETIAESTYTNIDKDNEYDVKKFCERYDLTSDIELHELCEKLQRIFQFEYTYTLKCGKTPDNKDFVNYFLSETRAGYCAHFASAATLIFRQLGIPARYVEGYVVDYGDGYIDEKSKVHGYIEGSDIARFNMVNAAVNDSQAHAWVEVFKSGYGWIPVDVTPISMDDYYGTYDGGGFLGGIMDIFSGNGTGGNTPNVFAKNKDRIYSAGAVITILVFTALLLFITIRIATIKILRNKAINGADYDVAVVNMLLYLEQMFDFVKIKRNTGTSYSDYINYNELLENYIMRDKLLQVVEYAQIAQFSNNRIDEEQYNYCKNVVYEVRKQILSSVSIFRKIWFHIFKAL